MRSKLFKKLMLLFLAVAVLLGSGIKCKEGKENQGKRFLIENGERQNSTGNNRPEVRIY